MKLHRTTFSCALGILLLCGKGFASKAPEESQLNLFADIINLGPQNCVLLLMAN